MEQPLVAISYPVNDEAREANLDALRDEARVVFLQDQQPSERLEILRRAEALIGWRLAREVPPDQLARATRLRLIQFLSAGMDNIDFTAIPAGVVIADNAGAYAKPMAEHVMAMTLSLAKRLPQRRREDVVGRAGVGGGELVLLQQRPQLGQKRDLPHGRIGL